MGTCAHLRAAALQHAAGAPEKAQEDQLGLLQARVARNGVQHPLPHLARVVRPAAKHVLQQQAVVLVHLRARQERPSL